MTMLLETLKRQYGIASKLLYFHLDGLTTDECLWRPAASGLHVYPQSDGRWLADWPDSEAYAIGPASIGWLSWHLGYWLTMVIDHSCGSAVLERANIRWPGDADRTIRWIGDLQSKWQDLIDNMDEAELLSDKRTNWPFENRPFADIIAWSSVEMTKNASEIGYARFLYASKNN